MRNTVSNNLKQFVKFSIVGILNTIISFSITYGTIFLVSFLFKNILPANKLLVLLATFLGFIISVLNSYYWNNKYVFKKTSSGNLKPLLKSYICYGSIFIFSYILNAFIFTKILNISHLFIPILQIIICTPLNFMANKLWAFK